jgi:alpha-L-fucosidase
VALLERLSPELARLRRREVPAWFHDAKLGIFIHWGPASVPAWAPRTGPLPELLARDPAALASTPYADWYENSLRCPESPTAWHHASVWGGRPYAAFAADFARGLDSWDPDAWAELFRGAGARYVVLVTKHHDGFCLWPSDVPNPRRPGWHTERDVVGELARAARARGLRFGVYYSGGLDWSFDTRPLRSSADVLASIPTGGGYPAYAEAQLRELIARYRPDVLWNDIAWPGSRTALWRLFADYYAAVPEGVVNDRFLPLAPVARLVRLRPFRALVDAALARALRREKAFAEPPWAPHADFRTPEYARFSETRREKWEATRGMGHSFAWNRNEEPQDRIAPEELVRSLADGVAKNGNLLLNVGPRGEDASIPEEQVETLAALGAWMVGRGEAIHGTRPAERAEGRTRDGLAVRFTARGDLRYAIVLGTPGGPELAFESLRVPPGARLRWLGEGEIEMRRAGPDLVVPAPRAVAPAHALEIRPPGAASSATTAPAGAGLRREGR